MSFFLELFEHLLETESSVWYRGTTGRPHDYTRGEYWTDSPEAAQEYGPKIMYMNLSIRDGLKLLTATHKENAINRDALIQRARSAGYDAILLPQDLAFAAENVYDEAEHDVLILLKAPPDKRVA